MDHRAGVQYKYFADMYSGLERTVGLRDIWLIMSVVAGVDGAPPPTRITACRHAAPLAARQFLVEVPNRSVAFLRYLSVRLGTNQTYWGVLRGTTTVSWLGRVLT